MNGAIQAGVRVGALVVVQKEGQAPDKHSLWSCRCDCGEIVIRKDNNLLTAQREARDTSCGCVKIAPNLSHGMRSTPEYAAWGRVKQRCLNRSNKDYPAYGGAGIKIEPMWVTSFQQFYNHIGPMPEPGMQIDRIDNTAGYFPGNVRWATREQQQRNRSTAYNWIVDGKHYESGQEAADAHGVTIQSVIRWTDGYYDPRRKSHTPAKANCSRTLRYGQP